MRYGFAKASNSLAQYIDIPLTATRHGVNRKLGGPKRFTAVLGSKTV